VSIFGSITWFGNRLEYPDFTFFGIATSVMIIAMAFGPGLFFLFCKRFEIMKPAGKPKNHQETNEYS
jgi:hypothetical protein